MFGKNQELLINELRHLHGEISSCRDSLGQKIDRGHNELREKIGQLEVQNGTVHERIKTLDDHDVRLRVLEKGYWKQTGVVGFIVGGAAIFFQWIAGKLGW